MDIADFWNDGMLNNADLEQLKSTDLRCVDKSGVEEFLYAGSPGEAYHVVRDIFDSVGREAMRSALFRFYVVTDVYLTAKMVMSCIGLDNDEFVEAVGSADSFLRQFEDEKSVFVYLTNLLENCINLRNDKACAGKSIAGQAKAYIAAHFHEPEISLSVVAESVNVCATYFSFIFKKETGDTFVSYLTHVRVEKAKALLGSSMQRVAQIASEVGYNDYHYFACIFKKIVGMTPSQFRKKSRATLP